MPPTVEDAPPRPLSAQPATLERWALVEPHRPALLAIARRRTLNDADAEDCVSEALLRAVQAEHLDVERVGAWLCTTVMRLAADSHRERDRQWRAHTRHALREPESCPSHQDTVCDRDEATWLWQRLTHVRGREREVLQARAAGRSVKETARQLGISEKAAENAWTRLRHKGLSALAATGAVTAVLGGWVRRSSLALPAVVLCGAVLAVDADGGTAPGRLPEPGQAVQRGAGPVPAPAAAVAAPTRSPTGSPARRRADALAAGSGARAGGPQRALATRPVAVGEAVLVGPTTVERRDEDRTMAESLRECVRQVPVLLGLRDPCSAASPHVGVEVDVEVRKRGWPLSCPATPDATTQTRSTSVHGGCAPGRRP